MDGTILFPPTLKSRRPSSSILVLGSTRHSRDDHSATSRQVLPSRAKVDERHRAKVLPRSGLPNQGRILSRTKPPRARFTQNRSPPGVRKKRTTSPHFEVRVFLDNPGGGSKKPTYATPIFLLKSTKRSSRPQQAVSSMNRTATPPWNPDPRQRRPSQKSDIKGLGISNGTKNRVLAGLKIGGPPSFLHAIKLCYCGPATNF